LWLAYLHRMQMLAKAIAQSKNTSSEWLIDSLTPHWTMYHLLSISLIDELVQVLSYYYSLIFYNLSLMVLGGSWERFYKWSWMKKCSWRPKYPNMGKLALSGIKSGWVDR
jgi:hypothetical protein